MKITQDILDELGAKAKESPRLRMHLDLRDSSEDVSQRMLNAIEPGSVLPVHRHKESSETMICLRGRLKVEYIDEQERTCTETFILEPNGVPSRLIFLLLISLKRLSILLIDDALIERNSVNF